MAARSTGDHGFDLPVRLVGGQEDPFLIWPPEAGQVQPEKMHVRQGQRHLSHARCERQESLADLEQGALHGGAVAFGKDLVGGGQEELIGGSEAGGLCTGLKPPFRRQACGEDAILSRGQGGELALMKIDKAGASSFHDEMVAQARTELGRSRAGEIGFREPLAVASADEGVWVRALLHRHAVPAALAQFDRHAVKVRVALEKMVANDLGKVSAAGAEVIVSEEVDGVFDGISGHDRAIVWREIGGVQCAREQDIGLDLADLMLIRRVLHDTQHADAVLAVTVLF
jgi:hypothetical protein